MAQCVQKGLEFFLHLKATVIGADRDQLRGFRAAPGHAPNDLNPFLANDVGGQRCQARALGNAQD